MQIYLTGSSHKKQSVNLQGKNIISGFVFAPDAWFKASHGAVIGQLWMDSVEFSSACGSSSNAPSFKQTITSEESEYFLVFDDYRTSDGTTTYQVKTPDGWELIEAN